MNENVGKAALGRLGGPQMIQTIYPAPAGAWPAGQAWYPLLNQFGPAGSLGPDWDDLAWDDLGWDESDERGTKKRAVSADSWESVDGRITKICDLETPHLRNILRMIERKHGSLAKVAVRHKRVKNLCNEWLKRF